MTFLHLALATAGFACVAIPIIIHFLFRNRRKPIQWAAMRFLIEALRKQRRRLRLEQMILLATRCLLIAAIAAAIGRPLLERVGLIGASAGRTIYFLIDNSLAASLKADGTSESALDRHRKMAMQQINSLAPGDRAGLVALASPTEALVVPASADLRAVGGVIESLAATDSRADIAGAIETLAARLRADASAGPTGATTQIVILSDFLRGSADLTRALPTAFAELPGISIIAPEPSQAVANNTQIISVEPLHALVLTGSGGNTQDAPVRVTLRRSGASNADAAVTTLRLGLADTQQHFRRPPVSTSVRWQPGQTDASVTVQLNTDPGQSAGESGTTATSRQSGTGMLIAELDRDSIEGDNTFRRPMSVRDAVQVGVVAQRQFGRTAGRVDRLGAAEWLRLALRPTDNSPIEIVDIEPSGIDAAALAQLDAVFVPAPDMVPVESWPRLRQFVDNAGLLIVSPSSDATVHLWTDAFTKALGLEWRLAREPEDAKDTTWSLSEDAGAGSLFALLEPELQPLLKPITISRMLGFQEPPTNADTLLKLRDGRPWLVAGVPDAPKSSDAADPATTQTRQARGLVLYLASAPVLSWTDLPARPLMVPLIQEIVKQGVGRATGSSTGVAGAPVLAPPSPSGVAELQRLGDEATRISVARDGLVGSPIRSAGTYAAIDQAGRNVGTLAINADADAGRVESQDPASIRAWLAGAWGQRAGDQAEPAVSFLDSQKPTATMATSDQGSSISVPLLFAALALALLETAMARWFSHARKETSTPTFATA